ncbi:hypothetical protein BKA70DRAFT_485806 [Coprinopsis sp. MPI-PUGE-AT-0042]|nr:hypothetical protein BKA70DRAFT_485806 [Coprinopsis sp. MPI-PUGE-AT-0042]
MLTRSALQFVLLLLFSFQLSAVLAKPAFPNLVVAKRSPTDTSVYQTNAQRLAAGLPPLAPKRRFSPTTVGLADRFFSRDPSGSGLFLEAHPLAGWAMLLVAILLILSIQPRPYNESWRAASIIVRLC